MNVKRPMDGVDSLGMNQALSLGMAKLGMNWEVVIVQSLVSSFVYLVFITGCFVCCFYVSDLTSLSLSLSIPYQITQQLGLMLGNLVVVPKLLRQCFLMKITMRDPLCQRMELFMSAWPT